MKTSSLLYLQRQNIDVYVLSTTSVSQAARMVDWANGQKIKLEVILMIKPYIFSSQAVYLIDTIHNKRQAFYTVICLNKFYFAVVVALPSYSLSPYYAVSFLTARSVFLLARKCSWLAVITLMAWVMQYTWNETFWVAVLFIHYLRVRDCCECFVCKYALKRMVVAR